MPAPRTIGVEEEYLLLDPATGALAPAAAQLIARAGERLPGWRQCGADDPARTADVKPEFFLEQVEIGTPPCTSLAELEQHLREARSVCAEVGHDLGVAVAALSTPVLAGPAGTVGPDPRYQAIRTTYGELAAQSLMCALHVHVETGGPVESVAVLDGLRPWLPVLLAISANSPYCRGVDTGYASWRSRLWEMWPSSGPPETFGSVDAHDRVTDRLVDWGSAADPALLNFGARRSPRYPTVEVRVADVCTDVRVTLLLAALVRGLADTALSDCPEWQPAPTWRTEELRAAGWHAARYGLSGSLIHPLEQRPAPAGDVLAALVERAGAALDAAGDLEHASATVSALLGAGTGAAHQRAAFARSGSLAAVALDAAGRTLL